MPFEIFGLMTALVDKSLVVYEDLEGEARYRLFETIRQYAGDRLEESGKATTYRRRHRDFFLALAEEAEELLKGPEQGRWLTRLETEHANLRQALTFCLEHGAEVESGLRLGAALQRFWFIRGHLSEGREFLITLLARSEAQEHTRARANALIGAGRLIYTQGDYNSARILFEESLQIGRELGNQHNIAHSLGNLGNVAWKQSDYVAATSLLQESLEIKREMGDRQGIARSLGILGSMAYAQRDYVSAHSRFMESLEIFKELEVRQGIADTLGNLGEVAWKEGDYAAARFLQAESLEMKRTLDDRHRIATSLISLGNVANSQGDYASARLLLKESLESFRELGDQYAIAAALESFAHLNTREDKCKQAARLWGAAERLRAEIGLPMLPGDKEEKDRLVASIRACIPESDFVAGWASGLAMTMKQAIEYALEEDR